MKIDDIKKLAPGLRMVGLIEKVLVPKFYAEKSEKMNRMLRILIVRPKEKIQNVPGLLWMHDG